ncbi:unnamed protein product [Colias eurytheme]|nr:unnamed protein product [Colias eurytheme]
MPHTAQCTDATEQEVGDGRGDGSRSKLLVIFYIANMATLACNYIIATTPPLGAARVRLAPVLAPVRRRAGRLKN